jgi:hypothetical protein
MVWEVAKPIPIAMKMTAALNLPALFMSIPFKIAFPTMSDTGAILAAIPCVPPVWYGVGLWFDRLTGRVPLSRRQYPTLRGIGRTTAFVLLCLTLVGMTPLNHHRGRDHYWMGGIMILWCALLLAITAKRHIEK